MSCYPKFMSFAFCPTRGRAFSAPLRFSRVIRQALSIVEALDEEVQPIEEPNWPPQGSPISEERADALNAHLAGEAPIEPAPTRAERTAYAAFQRELRKTRATRSPRRGRVPEFKFESNDGWVISRVEARTIARALEKLLTDEYSEELYYDVLDVDAAGAKAVRKQLLEFKRFNLRAAETGGYTVD